MSSTEDAFSRLPSSTVVALPKALDWGQWRPALSAVCLLLGAAIVGTSATGCATTPLTAVVDDGAPPLMFENVRVFVGDGRTLVRQDVAVVGGRIAFVAPHGTRVPPPSARIIAGKGKTLLPGLVDSHVHIGRSGAPPWTFISADIPHNLRAHLFSGSTTIVDLGGTLEMLSNTTKALEQGRVIGPDLFFAGPMVTVPEGYPVSLYRRMAPAYIPGFIVRDVVVGDTVFEVDTAQSARVVVQQIHEAGGHLLKVVVTDSFADGRLSGKLLKTVVDEAHLRGLRVFAHVATPEEAVDAAVAGVDILAHSPTLGAFSDDQIATLASTRIKVVPTLFSLVRLEALRQRSVSFSRLERQSEDAAMLKTMSADEMADAEIHPDLITHLDNLHANADAQRQNVGALHRAGVTILAGTDANGAPATFPAAIHNELASLVDAGLSPAAALMGATSEAAQALAGPNADFGQIRTGYRGNLVLVDGNPMRDIKDSAKVLVVVKDGVQIKRTPLTAPTNANANSR